MMIHCGQILRAHLEENISVFGEILQPKLTFVARNSIHSRLGWNLIFQSMMSQSVSGPSPMRSWPLWPIWNFSKYTIVFKAPDLTDFSRIFLFSLKSPVWVEDFPEQLWTEGMGHICGPKYNPLQARPKFDFYPSTGGPSLSLRIATAKFKFSNCIQRSSGEWANPSGTAMLGRLVTRPEQAPEPYPLSKISLISKRPHGPHIRY